MRCFPASSQGRWWWLLFLTHRAEAAPSWGPKSLLPLLLTRPSPSLRFQYNFQLTSMSIEQVGQPDCWPITGNHSAPQLSAQGEKGGREGGNGRERAPSLQAGKQFGFSRGALQCLGGTGVGEQGWMGRLMRAVQWGALTHPYRFSVVKMLQATERENWRLRAHEKGPGSEAWSRRGTEGRDGETNLP